MRPSPVWVVSPDPGPIYRLLGKLSGARFTWAYLGQDFAEHSRVLDLMPDSGTHISTIQGFHRSSQELREHYLTYLYDVGLSMGSFRWWVSSLAYRNGILSKTYHRICLLRSALDLVQSQEWSEPLVLVASEPLLTALERNLREEPGVRTSDIKKSGIDFIPLFRLFRDMAAVALHRIFFLVRNGFRLIQARQALSAATQITEPSSLILSWVTPENMELGEKYHESFFGKLADELDGSGHNVALAPVLLWGLPYKQVLSEISKSPFPLAVPHHYLRFRDLLTAAARTLSKPPKPQPLPSFCVMNIESLVDHELRDHWISNGPADALLVTAWIRRLAAEGALIDRFIYIYENQPMERALCWEVRRSYPKAKLIGYQHARAPRLWLNIHTAPDGEAEAPLPDRIVTVGKHTAQSLRRGGYANGSIVVGGALHMTLPTKESAGQPDQTTNKTVLVASSDSFEEASELAHLATHLARGDQNLQVIMKCHPRAPYKQISGGPKSQPPSNLQVSNEPILDLIRRSSLIIYSGSTVVVQSLSLGVPAIHVIPRYDLDLDPLEGAPDIRLDAFGLEDLRAKIAWMQENRESYIEGNRDKWRAFVDEMYGPVTEETFAAFSNA